MLKSALLPEDQVYLIFNSSNNVMHKTFSFLFLFWRLPEDCLIVQAMKKNLICQKFIINNLCSNGVAH